MANKQLLKIIKIAESRNETPIWNLELEAARERANKEISALCKPINQCEENIEKKEFILLLEHNNPIKLDLYFPSNFKLSCNILIYFHGGGFVFSTPYVTEQFCKKLCWRSGCIIVSVHYRLAPEFQFPCGLTDCYKASIWILENSSSIGGDGCKVAIAGDSAGGCFAAVISKMLIDKYKKHLIFFQLLIYPVLDLTFSCFREYDMPSDVFLHRKLMEWFRKHYLGSRIDELSTCPKVSPLLGTDFNETPPTILLTAGNDILLNEAILYLNKLDVSGIVSKHLHVKDMPHNFLMLDKIIDTASMQIEHLGLYIKQFFSLMPLEHNDPAQAKFMNKV